MDPSLVIYTNMTDGPDPQPTALASDLVATKTRAILVIDNCTPELHRRLSELCRAPESAISVLTIEYDIREDQPEGTEVFEMKPLSGGLIEKLVRHRFPALSLIDARRITDVSGRNARVAIALAGAAGQDTIAGLNDEELFQRLFWQRHEPNESLLLVAQACSLVYSFQGDDITHNDQPELARLGALIGKDAQEMFRNVAELLRRELAQQRGVWRAVLPHAIANRLAANALENIPLVTIQSQLVNGAPERLLRSFARRLGYLHASKEAVAIVRRWLGVGGLLENVATLNDLGRAMFISVAPVATDASLTALERVILGSGDNTDARNCGHYLQLLRALAYDPTLFERCVELMLRIADASDDYKTNEVRDVFASLFFVYLSGTHATIEQRLKVIESLLLSGQPKRRIFGLAALKAALTTSHFSGYYNFEFGARSRDYGYWPRTKEDVREWFRLTLRLASALSCVQNPSASLVRSALADGFQGLWGLGMYEELGDACRIISRSRFWPDGWIAVRRTQHFGARDRAPEIAHKLAALEELLRPRDLTQKVRTIVLSSVAPTFDMDIEDGSTENIHERLERMEATAEDLGKAVAADEEVFGELLVELLTSQGRLWSFGRGLAVGACDPRAVWDRLVAELAALPPEQRKIEILRGFVYALQSKNPKLANVLLDDALESETLGPLYPSLQTAAGIDKLGVDRLLHSLVLGKAPADAYSTLTFGRATDPISANDLSNLVKAIAAKVDGFDVAIDVLYMRLNSDKDRGREYVPELLDAGRELMLQLRFGRQHNEHHFLGKLCEICLVGQAGAAVVQKICHKLTQSISKYETSALAHSDLLLALLSVQPIAALDGLFAEDTETQRSHILESARWARKNALDAVPDDVLLGWCDQVPKIRYPAIATAITICHPAEGTGPRQWSSIALRLLDKAPDRVEVLRQFVQQFSPSSWSGSRATIVEANAKLLDKLLAYPDPAVAEFAAQEKIRLGGAIEQERRHETEMDQKRDERFE